MGHGRAVRSATAIAESDLSQFERSMALHEILEALQVPLCKLDALKAHLAAAKLSQVIDQIESDLAGLALTSGLAVKKVA